MEEKNEQIWEELRMQKSRDENVECQKGWFIEWKVARGELDRIIEIVRSENKMPKVGGKARGQWRRMEKKNDTKKNVFLREVKEELVTNNVITMENQDQKVKQKKQNLKQNFFSIDG